MNYPLSISQQDVLKLEEIAGAGINTLSFSVLFPYHGDENLLKKAADHVYARFPELNTVIAHQQNVLLPPDKLQIVHSVRSFSSRAEFDHWAQRMASAPVFVKIRCAGITPVVIPEEAEGYHIHLHHAIADGWAASLLLRCLADTYRDLLSGNVPCSTESYPYQAFVESEASYLSGPRGMRDAGFWKAFLAGHRDGHLLSGGITGDLSSVRMTESLAGEIVRKLETVCAEKGRTLQSVLMSAVSVTLGKMEDTTEFCLGTILLNRKSLPEQSMLGNCFATVPVPVSIQPDDTFGSLNDRLSDSLFSVMRRQRTSYSLLVSQAFDDPPGKPLFDVLVNLQDYSGFDSLQDQVSWYAPPCQLEAFQINLLRRSGSVDIHYDYRPDCISAEKLHRFHSGVLAVIEEIISGGWEKKISGLKQLPDQQMRTLLAWNDTGYPCPKDETLYSLFEKQLAVRRDQPALYYGSECLTYAEFELRVRKLSSHLTRLGLGPGKIAGVLLERSFDMMTAIYAVIRCGAAYMPIGTDTPSGRLAFMLRDSGAPVLLTHSCFSANVPETVCRIDLDSADLPDSTESMPVHARPELPAYVIYTSGSTGEPKGVLISHRSTVDRIHWMNRTFGMDPADVVLQKTPYTFDVSVWELFWWSNYGGRLALLPPDAHKDPEQIIRAVERYHVSKMHFVPSMLSAFLTYMDAVRCADRLHSLRQVFSSGEALMPAQANRFYRLLPETGLINLYGPTECTVDVSCFICPHRELNSIPIGKPVDNTQLYILDRDLSLLPIGAAGELCIAGNLVGIGYLNRPEMTKERFVDNPFGSGKLYRTGDLAYWNSNGEIEYLGRMDHQVKLRGQRLELGEIERCISSVPGIRDAIAAVQQQENGESVLVAYYTGRCESGNAGIKEALSAMLPDYMIPQSLMHLDVLPLSQNGKADRKRLPRISFEQSPDRQAVLSPQTETEKRICSAFAAVLRCGEEDVGLNFDFFENGGTSLLAIMLLAELLDSCQIQLKDIYSCPTPGKLARFIEQKDKANIPDDYSDEIPYSHIEALHGKNPGIGKGKSILLTGATGFLGIHLLHDLISRFDQAGIICLVRDPNRLEPYWNEMFEAEEFPGNRITCIPGDITREHLGMCPDDYEYCLHNVSAVYHSAADVRHFGSWERSYAVNTLGTEHVIGFCLEAGAVLHHVSTMSVDGFLLTTYWKKLSDVFTEEHLFIGQRIRDNVYAYSKYLAEKAILDARKKGLAANIYRVGNLLWRTRDGKFQKNREAHDFYMLTHAFLKLHAVAEELSGLVFDLTAVDCCAEAIGLLSAQEIGMVYHITNPYQVTLSHFLSCVSPAGIDQIPMDQFEERLRKHADDPQCGFLLSYLQANRKNSCSASVGQMCSQTVSALANLGFRWKEPSTRYMKYVS